MHKVIFNRSILIFVLVFSVQKNFAFSQSYSYSVTPPPDSLVVIAPNVFTPNNDGVNDHWSLVVHDYGVAILELQATVYDRWGKEVFHSTNLRQVWNGNNHIGKACEEGAYYYVVTFTNGSTRKQETFKGFLELLR